MRFVFLLCALLPLTILAEEQRFTLAAGLIDEAVTVQVTLPESYRHSDSFHYPLLLVLDGSTQFHHVASSVDFLSTYAIVPEMIVVGISTRDRLKYFTPTEPEDFAARAGKADVYNRFIAEELLPTLSERYRLAPYRMIFGHSLAGLYSSYQVLGPASSFNAAIAISPSLWWDDGALITDYDKYQTRERKAPMRWFLSMASEPGEMAQAFDAMLQKLETKKPSKLQVFNARFARETHDSTPLIGNVEGLKAIFSGWNAVPQVDVMSLQQLLAFYREKTAEYGYTFPLSAHQFNVYGLKAAYEGQTAWGVAILEQGVEKFARSEILWDSLATAYTLNQQLDKAMAASIKALQLARLHGSVFLEEIMAQNRALEQKLSQP
ncbi:alpha/beta hydrolase [Shewanella algae]|uniref:alpha/beta hydrolase n=1 Tax=Shewanella algae TaxID=38313 RepID=UPI0031F5726B